MPTRSFSRDTSLPPVDHQIAARICGSTAAIAEKDWNRLLPGNAGVPDNPFVDHRFFLALEQSGCATPETGWLPQHITLEDKTGAVLGLMPLFLKSHSMGEYVFDHAWAEAFEQAGGRYYPKLQCAVPFTPVSAPKLLAASRRPDLAPLLLAAAARHAAKSGASSIHATFLTAAEENIARHAGWLIRHDTQFHWINTGYASFDEFLGTLASRKRKSHKSERHKALAGGIKVRWLTGGDITEAHWDAFFGFYLDTGNRKWGQPYLNRDFFSLIGQSMADRIVLMLAHDGGEPIAGALSFRGRDTLYGRYWGARRDVPFLHFELCYYQAIDFAIAHGLRTVQAGAQGPHKLARGYTPVRTCSAHWIAHDGLRDAVGAYLENERRGVARDQQALERFTPYRRDQ